VWLTLLISPPWRRTTYLLCFICEATQIGEHLGADFRDIAVRRFRKTNIVISTANTASENVRNSSGDALARATAVPPKGKKVPSDNFSIRYCASGSDTPRSQTQASQ